MGEERPMFETRVEAEALCRERERQEPGASWLAFEAEGSWMAVRTNLPRHEDPMGTATEAKPNPSPADDPRTPQQQNAPWPGAP
jgi:hypothetical protein